MKSVEGGPEEPSPRWISVDEFGRGKREVGGGSSFDFGILGERKWAELSLEEKEE